MRKLPDLERMPESKIYAGSPDVEWSSGTWIFLDIGFSNSGRTCGLLVSNGQPHEFLFSEAKKEIKNVTLGSKSPVNLVIEAPLSVCFDSKGNPKGRTIEREGSRIRYWYLGLGCAVMVAAIYLIHELYALGPELTVPIRLYEGFVSFKDRSKKSRHADDVILLRDYVRNPKANLGSIYFANDLKGNDSDELKSATAIFGLDFGIPPIIKPKS